MSAQPKIRWNEQAQVFLGEYGNIRFGLTPAAAIILADALYQAVRTYRANRNPQDEADRKSIDAVQEQLKKKIERLRGTI